MNYEEKLQRFSEQIKYMEEMYGINIDEWQNNIGDGNCVMTPLHYLDALDLYYKGKVSGQLPRFDVIEDKLLETIEGNGFGIMKFMKWMKKRGYCH